MWIMAFSPLYLGGVIACVLYIGDLTSPRPRISPQSVWGKIARSWVDCFVDFSSGNIWLDFRMSPHIWG